MLNHFLIIHCLKFNDVIRWSDEWDLKFNVGKISLVRFSKKGYISLSIIMKFLIMAYHFLTLLEILVFTFLLTCHGSITSINMAKAYKMLGLLRSLTSNVLSVRKQLYISLVRSQLS